MLCGWERRAGIGNWNSVPLLLMPLSYVVPQTALPARITLPCGSDPQAAPLVKLPMTLKPVPLVLIKNTVPPLPLPPLIVVPNRQLLLKVRVAWGVVPSRLLVKPEKL